MCMDDVRLGRKSLSDQVDIAPTTVSAEVLTGADNRIAIVFNRPSVGTVTYSLHQPAVLGQGITLGAGDGSVSLDIQRHGGMVCRPWQAISDQAGGAPSAILFTLLSEK